MHQAQKRFTAYPPVFFECGQCGYWHHNYLPGCFDCRDDRYRFTSDELDAYFGPANWEEITLEDQEDRLKDIS